MKRIKKIFALSLLLATMLTTVCFNVNAADFPVFSIEDTTLTVTDAQLVEVMVYAKGVYSSKQDMVNGPVPLATTVRVAAKAVDGVYVCNLGDYGSYTFCITLTSGAERLFVLTAEPKIEYTPYITTEGSELTVHDLYDIKDLFIAKGEHDSYRALKNNGYIVSATYKKVKADGSYSYILPESGRYTVIVRYKDTQRAHKILKTDIELIMPTITANGLQLKVTDIGDTKTVRVAKGIYSSVADMKKGPNPLHNYQAARWSGKGEFTIQLEEPGAYTVAVQLVGGYTHIFCYQAEKKEPCFYVDENSVSFEGLEDLYVIRYAPGLYETSAQIKRAEGSRFIKPAAITDGRITVSDLAPGRYTFCVQYNDQSYNCFVIDIL
ncbi:MAG: hypothetical protein IJB24_03955 [Clostridia bacterium]|nr:hypothetical protein [Clostridia bacterium]